MKLAPLGLFYFYVLHKISRIGKKKKKKPKKKFANWV